MQSLPQDVLIFISKKLSIQDISSLSISMSTKDKPNPFITNDVILAHLISIIVTETPTSVFEVGKSLEMSLHKMCKILYLYRRFMRLSVLKLYDLNTEKGIEEFSTLDSMFPRYYLKDVYFRSRHYVEDHDDYEDETLRCTIPIICFHPQINMVDTFPEIPIGRTRECSIENYSETLKQDHDGENEQPNECAILEEGLCVWNSEKSQYQILLTNLRLFNKTLEFAAEVNREILDRIDEINREDKTPIKLSYSCDGGDFVFGPISPISETFKTMGFEIVTSVFDGEIYSMTIIHNAVGIHKKFKCCVNNCLKESDDKISGFCSGHRVMYPRDLNVEANAECIPYVLKHKRNINIAMLKRFGFRQKVDFMKLLEVVQCGNLTLTMVGWDDESLSQ